MNIQDSELVVSGRWEFSNNDRIESCQMLIESTGELVLAEGTVIIGCRITVNPREGDRHWYSGEGGFITQCEIVRGTDGN